MRDPFFRSNKSEIRNFMRGQYSDKRLAETLDHARSGQMSYWSCCCFIGIVTADHALQSWNMARGDDGLVAEHYALARAIPFSRDAEDAYHQLAPSDAQRARMLIPMILAEIRRRHRSEGVPELMNREMAVSR